MSVHAPGRVDLGGLKRARTGIARALARVRPSSAPIGGGRRKLMAGLSMTSMIDVLVAQRLPADWLHGAPHRQKGVMGITSE